MAASQQGGNPMLAYRNAMNNAATAQQQGANQAAQLTATNALNSQGLLGTTATTVGGQQIGLNENNANSATQNSQFNVAQQNQTAATNLGSAVAQKQFVDNLVAQYQTQGMSLEQAQVAANQAYAEQQQNSLTQQIAAANGIGVAEAGQTAGAIGAGLSAAGTAASGISSAAGTTAAVSPAAAAASSAGDAAFALV